MTPTPLYARELPRLLLAVAGCLLALVAPILLVSDGDPRSLELRFHLALLCMLGGSLGVLALAWAGRRRPAVDDPGPACVG